MTNKVLVAGDWHGSSIWAKAVVNRAHELGIDTIYHVGDFGWMGRGGMHYTEQLSWYCEDKGVKIWVTPGNHENWAILDELFKEFPEEPAPIAENKTIFMLPRGFRWERAGVSFLSLGGAPSIDRNMRNPYIDWWPTEILTQGDVIRAAEGGYVDVMITHDAPTYAPSRVHDIIYKDSIEAANYFGQDIIAYCNQGHGLLNEAYRSINPRLLFHGHYHVHTDWCHESLDQRIIGLEQEGKRNNTVILDLDELRGAKEVKDLLVKPSGAFIK